MGSKTANPVWHDPEVGDEVANSEVTLDSNVPTDLFLAELPAKAHELIYLLYWLHTTSVPVFEAAPFFGSERMKDFTLFDQPSPPKHLPLLYHDPKTLTGPPRQGAAGV